MNSRLDPIVLEGRFVRLEPLAPEHAEDLALVAEPELFTYHFPPDALTPAGFRQQIEMLQARESWRPFAQVATDTGRAVGVTCYLDVSPIDEWVEIGHTWIARERHGTKINPEAKLLLLDNAFANGFGRVQLKTDALNLHSQAALQKLGAQREGVLRRNKWTPGGRIRDTVVYGILAKEWPGVRAGLLARL